MKMKCCFTLIELLVVIAIIVILAALLFPALQQARVTAKKAFCQNTLRQIGISMFSYANDFNEWGPVGYTGNHIYIWPYSCFKGYYLPDLKATKRINSIICPGWETVSSMGNVEPTNNRAFSAYNVPFGKGNHTDVTRPAHFFGWNSNGITIVDGINTMPCPNMKMLGTKVSDAYNTCKFLEPSQQPLAGDIAAVKTSPTIVYYTTPALRWPHEGANNIFFDGHISYTVRRNLDRYVYFTTIRWK